MTYYFWLGKDAEEYHVIEYARWRGYLETGIVNTNWKVKLSK